MDTLSGALGVAMLLSLGGNIITAIDNSKLEVSFANAKTKIAKLEGKLNQKGINLDLCKANLNHQNKVIEDMRTHQANFVPETVERIVYRHLPADINMSVGGCENAEVVNDFINHNISN